MTSTAEWRPHGLDPYEQEAWDEIQAYKRSRLSARARQLVPRGVRTRAVELGGRLRDSRVGETVSDSWQQLQDSYLDKVVEGAGAAIGDLGASLVPTTAVARAYAKHGTSITSLDEILALDLRLVDRVMPRLGRRYAAGSATEGALAGFIAGGGSVFAAGGATTGGVGAAPGLAVVSTALATDVAATITSSVVLAGHYGAYCGFDVDTDDPREQAFLLGVLGAASAGSMAAKDLAFTQTRQLAMMIVRRATWSDLSEKAITKVVQQIFKRLSVRLTKQKFGQALPVAGAGIGAGLNYQLLRRVGNDARMLYRERFLIEKYATQPEAVDIHIEDIEIISENEASDEYDR